MARSISYSCGVKPMRRLLERLASRWVRWSTGLGTLAFLIFFNLWGAAAGVSSQTVVNFELAWTPQQLQQVLATLTPAGSARLHAIVWIDLAFIPCYAAWGAGMLTWRLRSRPLWQHTQSGVVLASLPLIAAGADYVENACELTILAAPAQAPAEVITLGASAASLKFALLIAALLQLGQLSWRSWRTRSTAI